MKFEWDEQKNRINRNKHKVRFELAQLAFEDPLHLIKFDRVVNGEERWLVLGCIMGRHVLVVAHTYRNREGEEISYHRLRRWFECAPSKGALPPDSFWH